MVYVESICSCDYDYGYDTIVLATLVCLVHDVNLIY
jgi:hypothetical protein